MNSIDDVYRAFGYAAEVAQLLETELGTILLTMQGEEMGLLTGDRTEEARALFDKINRSTLGNVIKTLQGTTNTFDHAADDLAVALAARNRLSHSFFCQHNNRRNTEAGRAIMLADLAKIHATIFTAYELALKMSGIDLKEVVADRPTRHLKLE